MKTYCSLLFSVLLCVGWSNAQSGSTIFEQNDIHEIRVYFSSPDFWDTLDAHYLAYNNFGAINENAKQYLMADSIRIDGTKLDSVGLRQKGNSSNWFTQSQRKPMKLDFKEFKDQKYEGLKKLNLSNSFADGTLLREVVAYQLYRELGIPAPRISFAKVYLNDQYWGLYNCVEQIDSEFIEDHFDMADGDLYKPRKINSLTWYGPNWSMYQDTFQLRTNELTSNHSDFFEFLEQLNTTPDASLEAILNTVLNVEQYVKFLSAEVIVNNTDGHVYYNWNHYLYHDLESGKFHFLPWDHNFSISSSVSGLSIITDYDALTPSLQVQENVLVSRIQSNSSLRDQYFNALCFALDKFSIDHVGPTIDSLAALIKNDVLIDPYLPGGQWNVQNEQQFENNISFLKSVIEDRTTTIMNQFQSYNFNCALDIEESSITNVKIYPNPTTSTITVESETPINEINLFDISGKKILRTLVPMISVKHLDAGAYIVQVVTDKGTIQKRIIKQ